MTELSGMDKYKFRRALEQIEEAVGRGTELVSVYIPPERPIFDVTNYLRAELSQSSNIKSASTRKHVTRRSRPRCSALRPTGCRRRTASVSSPGTSRAARTRRRWAR